MIDMTSFPIRLKELRRANNITQAQLAKKVGLCEMTISKYENGGKPNYLKVLEMAEFFGVSMYYLLGYVDDPRRLR